MDAAVLLVGGDGLMRAAVGDVVERAAFPWFGLALVVDQFDGEPARDDGAEGAAGLDLRQLSVVADKDELAVRVFDVLEQLRELPGGCHAGLVDHQHARRGQSPAVAEVVQQRGGAGRFDAGARREFAGGATGDGDAEHRVAGLLPRLAGGRERECLAGPGLAGHHRRPGSASGRRARASAAARPTVRAAGRPRLRSHHRRPAAPAVPGVRWRGRSAAARGPTAPGCE